MKVIRNLATIAITLTLAGGLNGCSELFPTASHGSDSVGQIQALSPTATASPTVTATPDHAKEGSESTTLPTSEPTQPVQQPSAPPVADPAPDPVAAPAPAPAPVSPVVATADGQAWILATEAKYGVYAPEGTTFVFGPMPAICAGADGCTVYSYRADLVPFNIVITFLPGTLSEYLLFHEIGHSRGIRDECEADNFARTVIGPVKGYYC